MASATVVAVGGQLALSAASSSVAARRGPKGARQCRGASTTARLLLGARPLSQQLRFTGLAGVAPGSSRNFSIVAEASETQVEASTAVSDLVKTAQEAWEKADDKLAIGGLGFAGLLVLWASIGLLSAIDKLPLIPGFFEFVGILVSGFFTYRYLLFKPDREELLKLIGEAKGKITGKEY